MAISFVNYLTPGFFSGVTSSLTQSYTVSAGSDRFLLVGVITNDATSYDVVSGVTYAGVSMTRVNFYQTTYQKVCFYWYVLHAPATGANNVVVTFTESTDYPEMVIEEYTGVNQASSVNTTSNNNASGNLTLSFTTTEDNCWLVSWGRNDGPPGAGTGTTKRGAAQNAALGDSNGAKTPAGSHSMQWTAASATTWGCGVAIEPSGAAPTANTGFFSFM